MADGEEKKKNKSTCDADDPFMSSLERMNENDIMTHTVPDRKRFNAEGLIRLGVIALCLCVFVFCAAALISRFADYIKSDSLYDSLSDIWYNNDDSNNVCGKLEYSYKDSICASTPDYKTAQSGGASGNEGGVSGVIGDSQMLISLKARMNAIKLQNKDFVGWITIDNTDIDYPVVLCSDNSYYLNHGFDKTYSVAGAIFADYRNGNDFSDYNTVIYGHNLISGKMFSDLDMYFNKSFFEKNKYIYIYNEYGIYIYEVFNISKMSIEIDYTRVSFASPEAFVEFANTMKSYSSCESDVSFTETDKILTLSTCTNAHNPAERYCLQAKLVEIQK